MSEIEPREAPAVWGWVDDVTWWEYVDGQPTTSRLRICANEADARAAVGLDPEARVLIRAQGSAVAWEGGKGHG